MSFPKVAPNALPKKGTFCRTALPACRKGACLGCNFLGNHWIYILLQWRLQNLEKEQECPRLSEAGDDETCITQSARTAQGTGGRMC